MNWVVLDSHISDFLEFLYPYNNLPKDISKNEVSPMTSPDSPTLVQALPFLVLGKRNGAFQDGNAVRVVEVNQSLILSRQRPNCTCPQIPRLAALAFSCGRSARV